MLRVFGPPGVSGDPGLKLKRMTFVAAAMLDLLPSRELSRDALAARLWPASPGPAAANSLRQVISAVRAWEKATGRTLFVADGKTIARPLGTEQSDLTTFMRIVDVGTSPELQRLDELYRGDLLETIDGLEGEAAIWLAEQRAALRDRFGALATEGAIRVGGQLAEDILRRLAQDAPYDDSLVRAQLVVASRRRDGVALKRLYDAFVERLQIDLGGEPEPKTVALIRELLPQHAIVSALRPVEITVSAKSIPRVLILPPAPDQLAGAGGDALLCGALIDEVTHSLSRARTFAVFAPHTARQLSVAPFPVGNPYGADYLVTTSLLAGPRASLRLTATIASIHTHEVLLSDEMRFASSDLRPNHYNLATALASRLAGSIERSELAAYRSTGSASAYVHYLLGVEDAKSVHLQGLRRAQSHLRQAARLSPGFARARALLSRSMCLEWVLLDREDKAPLLAALEQAERALLDDPIDPVVRREVGHALIYLDRLDEAVEMLKTAADHGPHFADVLCNLADGLLHIGRVAEARPVLDRALDLNPLPPDLYHWIDSTSHFLLGDYEAAKASIRQMKTPASAARIGAAAEALSGNLREARRYRDIYLADHPEFRVDDYMIPIRSRTDREHLLAGLRAAGFV